MVSWSTIVNRSTTCKASLWNVSQSNHAFPLKFVESTINVLPSHRPRGSPIQSRMPDVTCGRLSSGMMRVLVVPLGEEHDVPGGLEELVSVVRCDVVDARDAGAETTGAGIDVLHVAVRIPVMIGDLLPSDPGRGLQRN